MFDRYEFGKRFKAAVDARGMTQKAVADKINTTEVTICRYAKGERIPTIETAVELAKVLNVSLDSLAGLDSNVTPRLAPDVNILVSCYSQASFDDRRAIWLFLARYMSPDQKIIIDAMLSEEKADVG